MGGILLQTAFAAGQTVSAIPNPNQLKVSK
jgi:hypothetical protein